MKVLAETQSALVEHINSVVSAANASGDVEVEKFKSSVQVITKQAFPKGNWPETLQPLPLLNMKIAAMYKLQGNYLEAFRYGLRGCLSCRRSGPKWVHHLFDLIQHFVPLVVQPKDSAIFRDKKFLTGSEMWDVYHGYLREVAITSKAVYGEDTTFEKAIQRWWNEALGSASEPRPGTSAFAKWFMIVQGKVLAWAEVEESKGIVLSK
jgi:hypothetical protein